ncbi:hypothetical protein [Bradyrhizobium mercantei]|uniref:hypothetical protein n=1 Tax=Bradyrhizobium mercantei TaxID=1904807 RepID=UPI001177F853|nr:hypothetical protein [Bradyrhizobium mercantei]
MQLPLERHQVFSRHDFCSIVSRFIVGCQQYIENAASMQFSARMAAMLPSCACVLSITSAARARRNTCRTASGDRHRSGRRHHIVSDGATSGQLFPIDARGENYYLLRIDGAPVPLRNPYQYVSLRIALESRHRAAPPLCERDVAHRRGGFVPRRPFPALFLPGVATPGFDLSV